MTRNQEEKFEGFSTLPPLPLFFPVPVVAPVPPPDPPDDSSLAAASFRTDEGRDDAFAAGELAGAGTSTPRTVSSSPVLSVSSPAAAGIPRAAARLPFLAGGSRASLRR